MSSGSSEGVQNLDTLSGTWRPAGGPQSALNQLERALRLRTEIEVVRTGNSLRIKPKSSGFPITIGMLDDGCHVDFGGCAQEFDDPNVACDWVMRAVSPGYRLRIDMRGQVAYRWSLERQGAADGEVAFACGHARVWSRLWPFSRPRHVVHRAYAAMV